MESLERPLATQVSSSTGGEVEKLETKMEDLGNKEIEGERRIERKEELQEEMSETSSQTMKKKKDDRSSSSESDDGVKEGDSILYVGEGDEEGKIMTTNPQRRKMFKKERKQRLRRIAELRREIEHKKRESEERKREHRRKKAQSIEEEYEANKKTSEEHESIGYDRMRHMMMRRYLHFEKYNMEYYGDCSEKKHNRDRILR